MKLNSFSFSSRIIALAVGALLVLFLSALMGIETLAPTSYLFIFSIFLMCVSELKRVRNHPNEWTTLGIGWLLFLGALILNLFWLRDIWLTPSQDDTINHLAILELILKSHIPFLNQISHPGSNWFGTNLFHFYPSGSHALTALVIYPFYSHGFDLVGLYRGVLIFILSLWPSFLWWGSAKRFPEISVSFRLFLVVSAFTLPMFPLFALGEGGISRITGMVLAAPIWFEMMSSRKSFSLGLIYGSVFFPVMLLIHPSLIVLFLVPVFFNPLFTVFGMACGSVIGGLLLYLAISSGSAALQDASLYQEFIRNIPLGLSGWVERMKGPLHYWFDDSMGFGKFFSPKNYFLYGALWLVAKRRLPLKLLILFFTPFALATLALLPFHWAELAGVPFYHSVKRIVEWIPLLFLTLACFSAVYLETQQPQKFRLKKYLPSGLSFLGLTFLVLFVFHSAELLKTYHEQFHTHRSSEVQSMSAKLKVIPASATILVDQHEFDYLRFTLPQTVYTLWTECSDLKVLSQYCLKRREFGATVLENKVEDQNLPEIWWIPPQEVLAQGLASIQLNETTRIIRIHEAH